MCFTIRLITTLIDPLLHEVELSSYHYCIFSGLSECQFCKLYNFKQWKLKHYTDKYLNGWSLYHKYPLIRRRSIRIVSSIALLPEEYYQPPPLTLSLSLRNSYRKIMWNGYSDSTPNYQMTSIRLCRDRSFIGYFPRKIGNSPRTVWSLATGLHDTEHNRLRFPHTNHGYEASWVLPHMSRFLDSAFSTSKSNNDFLINCQVQIKQNNNLYLLDLKLSFNWIV